MKDSTVSRVMREMGSKGGKRAMETMTPAERTARAKKASAAAKKARAARKKGA